jgi:hypothetical protein
MINNMLFIENVRTFVDYYCHGDGEFQNLTMTFGENRSGNTILYANLRSPGTGDARYLLGIKSINSSREPEACIRVNSASHTRFNRPIAKLERCSENQRRPVCAACKEMPEFRRIAVEVRLEN